PPVSNVMNRLHYWVAMAASGHPLAPMALNFLSVPEYYVLHKPNYIIYTTSTDVECAFLRGGLTISKMRHLLSDKSMQAASVLGA
ncbi:hypothetical protein PILCRDRAFT_77534, partial [Piloderma croceum F 1598]